MNLPCSPEKVLLASSKILDSVLTPCGFDFVLQNEGQGSGGRFASGRYVNRERFLELHFRQSLGLVAYHIGNETLDHETYMKFLGVYGSNAYPDFRQDPLDSFLSLAGDLERYCDDFLRGDGVRFRQFATELKRDPGRFTGLP